jgi:acetylornithine deacetylase
MEDILKYLDLEGTVKLCQQLVRIPSPVGNEKNIALHLAGVLRKTGLDEVELIEGEKDRPNVLARYKGTGGGRSLLFYGHIDSESPGVREEWTMDPYGGEIKDGKIYGRASKDMRAGISSFIKAAEAVIRRGVRPKGDLILAFCVDEEVAGPNGIGYLVKNGHVKADAAIYGETYHLGDIMRADSGFLWLKITSIGVPAHCQLKTDEKKSVNAVEKMAKLILKLSEVRLPFKPHPLFKGMYPGITAGTTIYTRENQLINAVPDRCTATFDVRLLPGMDTDEVFGIIQKTAGDLELEDGEAKFAIEEISRRGPTEIPENHPIIQTISRNFEKVTGRKARVVGHEMTSDEFFLRNAGIMGVHFGPGNWAGHKPDEHIEIEQIHTVARVYALCAHDYLFT